MSEDLDRQLTALLREQAASVAVPDAATGDLRPAVARRRRPRLLLPAMGVAALVCAVVVMALARVDDGPQQVTTGPADETGAPPAHATTHPSTTTATEPAHAGPFHAETRQVLLTADAVTIRAGDKTFVTAAPVEVRGDPGEPKSYTTLELTWREHSVEMRLFIYFSSDGNEWWSDEIRTSDGDDPGEWITYKGDFFRRPLGQAFTGDFTVATPGPAVGSLNLSNLHLEAFRTPAACTAGSGPFVLDPGTSPITMEGYLSGYATAVHLLSTPGCTLVPDEDHYTYEWTSSDPGVVTVERFVHPELTRRADLKPGAKGTAIVHVKASDPKTGDVLAETDIEVIVGDVTSVPAPTTLPAPAHPATTITSNQP